MPGSTCVTTELFQLQTVETPSTNKVADVKNRDVMILEKIIVKIKENAQLYLFCPF